MHTRAVSSSSQDLPEDWLTSPTRHPCWLATHSEVVAINGTATLPLDQLQAALEAGKHAAPRLAPLAVEQYVLGRGDAQGRLVVRVTAQPDAQGRSVWPAGSRVWVLQSLPWVLRPWLHAMRVDLEEAAGGTVWVLGGGLDCGSWVQPGSARSRPAAVGLCVALPTQAAAVRVVLPFAKGFMHVDEHPPDSERGVDVPSATAVMETPLGARYTVCTVDVAVVVRITQPPWWCAGVWSGRAGVYSNTRFFNGVQRDVHHEHIGSAVWWCATQYIATVRQMCAIDVV